MVVPAIIQGCFAGFFVIWLTGVIFPRANFTAVTYTFCTVVACITLVTLAMAAYNRDLASLETVAFIISGISTIAAAHFRSDEHTSELQSLMRISYAVLCLKKKTK